MQNRAFIVVACLLLVAAPAHARAKSGVVPEGALLPDIWQPGTTIKEVPISATVPQDACTSVAHDPYAYAVCEDRLAKIARLRASVEARRAVFQAVPGTLE